MCLFKIGIYQVYEQCFFVSHALMKLLIKKYAFTQKDIEVKQSKTQVLVV